VVSVQASAAWRGTSSPCSEIFTVPDRFGVDAEGKRPGPARGTGVVQRSTNAWLLSGIRIADDQCFRSARPVSREVNHKTRGSGAESALTKEGTPTSGKATERQNERPRRAQRPRTEGRGTIGTTAPGDAGAARTVALGRRAEARNVNIAEWLMMSPLQPLIAREADQAGDDKTTVRPRGCLGQPAE